MSRNARISGIFGRLSEEGRVGCSVRRMPADFHHGLLGPKGDEARFRNLGIRGQDRQAMNTCR